MLYWEWDWEKANEITAKEHEAIGEARGNKQALTIFKYLRDVGRPSDFETVMTNKEQKEEILKQASLHIDCYARIRYNVVGTDMRTQ